MKFVTRVHAKVDRIACPWLIRRFVDADAVFLFVDQRDVMTTAQRENAIPFDVANVELGHHGPYCTFDAILLKYDLRDPALHKMAKIVRGADTKHRDLTPESAGLYAIAHGFATQAPAKFADDHALMEAQFPLYDALYAFCRQSPST